MWGWGEEGNYLMSLVLSPTSSSSSSPQQQESRPPILPAPPPGQGLCKDAGVREGQRRGTGKQGYRIQDTVSSHTIHSTGYRILYPGCIGYSSPSHTSDQLDTQPAPVLPPPHTGRLWSIRGGNHWKTKFQSSRKSMFRAKKYLFVQFQETRSRYGQN